MFVCVCAGLPARPALPPAPLLFPVFQQVGTGAEEGRLPFSGAPPTHPEPRGGSGPGGTRGLCQGGCGDPLGWGPGGHSFPSEPGRAEPGFAAGRWLHLQDMALARSPAGWGLRVPLASTAGGGGRPSRAQRSGGLLCSWGGSDTPQPRRGEVARWQEDALGAGCRGDPDVPTSHLACVGTAGWGRAMCQHAAAPRGSQGHPLLRPHQGHRLRSPRSTHPSSSTHPGKRGAAPSGHPTPLFSNLHLAGTPSPHPARTPLLPAAGGPGAPPAPLLREPSGRGEAEPGRAPPRPPAHIGRPGGAPGPLQPAPARGRTAERGGRCPEPATRGAGGPPRCAPSRAAVRGCCGSAAGGCWPSWSGRCSCWSWAAAWRKVGARGPRVWVPHGTRGVGVGSLSVPRGVAPRLHPHCTVLRGDAPEMPPAGAGRAASPRAAGPRRGRAGGAGGEAEARPQPGGGGDEEAAPSGG